MRRLEKLRFFRAQVRAAGGGGAALGGDLLLPREFRVVKTTSIAERAGAVRTTTPLGRLGAVAAVAAAGRRGTTSPLLAVGAGETGLGFVEVLGFG